ncbi:MAG: DUF4198 domain-containing protein, partial [Maribacter sp.]
YPIELVPLENPYDLNTGDKLRVKLLFNGEPLANQLVYANFKALENGQAQGDQDQHGHGHDEAAESDNSHDAENAEHRYDTTEEERHSHKDETTKHSHGDQAEHSHGDSTENNHSHAEGTEEHSHDTEGGTETHTHTVGQQLRTDAEGLMTAELTADGIWYLQTIHLVKTEEEGFTHESNWTTLTFQVTHAHGEDTHTHEHEDEGGIPYWTYWACSLLLVGLLFFWFNKKK